MVWCCVVLCGVVWRGVVLCAVVEKGGGCARDRREVDADGNIVVASRMQGKKAGWNEEVVVLCFSLDWRMQKNGGLDGMISMRELLGSGRAEEVCKRDLELEGETGAKCYYRNARGTQKCDRFGRDSRRRRGRGRGRG